MEGHRTVWVVTGLAVVVAALVAAYRWREGQDRAGPERAPRHDSTTMGPINDGTEREETVARLFDLLEADPRARLRTTKSLVEQVSRWTETGLFDEARGHYALGLLRYYGQGDPTPATEAFEKALALDPKWSWPHNALGIVLFDVGRRDEALDAFGRAMALDPQWSRPYVDLTILYRRAGDIETAKRYGLTALERDPDNAATHNNYGVLLDTIGRHEEARPYYLHALELDADLPAAHYNLACSYGRNGDAEKAAEILAKAIALDEVFREGAKHDPDFEPVWEVPLFHQLLWGPDAPMDID